MSDDEIAGPNFTEEANFLGGACTALMFALENWTDFLAWSARKSALPDPDRAREEMTETLLVLDARYMMEVKNV